MGARRSKGGQQQSDFERVVGRPRRRLSGGFASAIVPVAVVAAAVIVFRPGAVGQAIPTSPPAAVSPTAGLTSPEVSVAPEPSGPIVADQVVDRPGVPAGLHDRYWFSESEAGQLGTTARLVLPENERALGADRGLIASIVLDGGGASAHVRVGPGGATINVRDIVTGATVRTLDTTAVPSADGPKASVLVGSELIWTAVVPAPETDGGLWVVDLADPSSTPTALIPAGADLKSLGDNASRYRVRASASGATIISNVGGEAGIRTDVVDLKSRTVRETLSGAVLAASDSYALVRTDYSQNPGDLTLLELGSNHEIGRIPYDVVYDSSVGETAAYVALVAGGDYVITSIDLKTAKAHEIFRSASRDLYMASGLSSEEDLVMLPDVDVWNALAGRNPTDPLGAQAIAGLLDPATGALTKAAFTVGAP